MKTAGRWAGYVLFFLFCTALFVYLTAPTDQARRFAELKLAEVLGADRVEIGALSLSGVGGVIIEDVIVELPPLMLPTMNPDVKEPGPVRLLQLARLEVDAGIGAIFGGPLDVAFEAEIQAGRIKSGRYQHEPGGPHVIQIEGIEGVALGSEQLFLGLVGMDIVGDLNGRVELSLATKPGPTGQPVVDFESTVGQIELLIRDAVVRQPSFDSPAGRLILGDARLGDVELTVLIDRASNLEAFKQTARRGGGDSTIIHIASGAFDGEDLAVQLAKNSAITLLAGRPLKDAAVNIHMSVEVKDAYIDQEVEDPDDPSKVSRPNTTLRFMLQQPQLRQVTENGIFGLGITGLLGSPRIRPERSVIREGISARRPNLDRPEPPSGGVAPDEDEDAEEDGAAAPVREQPAQAAERRPPARAVGGRAPTAIGRATPGVARPQLPTGGYEPQGRYKPQPAVNFQPPPIPIEPDPEPEPEYDPEYDPAVDPDLDHEGGYEGDEGELPEGELPPEDELLPEYE